MAKLFKDVLARIKSNKAIKESGQYNCIPFPFKRLRNYIPGIMRGVQYSIVAQSGIGKTQLAKFLFVFSAYKFVKEHPEAKIKLKILYFALEESKEEFMYSLISNRLREQYGLSISVLELQSMHEKPLDDETIRMIEECEEYFSELEECLEIYDSISNPTGILFTVRDYSRANGTHYMISMRNADKVITWDQYDQLSDTAKREYKYLKYEAYDTNEFVIVITDHISLISEEKENGKYLNKQESMVKFSASYCRQQITKHYKYVVVNVQQLAAAGEQTQYTHAGKLIDEKLLPTLEKFADCKLTARDSLVVLALFAPDRYGIKSFLGYDVEALKDNFRALMVLKNRIGRPNLRLGLYFDGETNTFEELELPKYE